MKTKDQQSGPDMTAEQNKELRELRKTEKLMIRAEGARERRLLADIARVEKYLARRCKQLRAKAEKAVRLEEKEAARLVKPLQKEWSQLTRGLVKNDKLAAVRHRIAILEGRGN
jgi:hypothetical protein